MKAIPCPELSIYNPRSVQVNGPLKEHNKQLSFSCYKNGGWGWEKCDRDIVITKE